MSSQVRQNFHQDCEAAINRQINLELYASYVYMSMVRMGTSISQSTLSIVNLPVVFTIDQSCCPTREWVDVACFLWHWQGSTCANIPRVARKKLRKPIILRLSNIIVTYFN